MSTNMFVIFALILIFDHTDGDLEQKFFRNDYDYLDATDSYYKFHPAPSTWQDAKKRCYLEGTSLFFPEDGVESDAVRQYWQEKQNISNFIHVGVTDLLSKGVFKAVNGLPIDDIYINWAPGSPNNLGGDQRCVKMNRQGLFDDIECSLKHSYICKKRSSSIDWDFACDMPNTGYKFQPGIDRCYKFYTIKNTWEDASAVCSADQSYLAIINSDDELTHLLNLTILNTPKAALDKASGKVYLGFYKDTDVQVWRTIHGVTLDDVGYNKWQDVETEGTCGSMLYNGRLDGANCEQKNTFICEHEIIKLYGLIEERFGEVLSKK